MIHDTKYTPRVRIPLLENIAVPRTIYIEEALVLLHISLVYLINVYNHGVKFIAVEPIPPEHIRKRNVVDTVNLCQCTVKKGLIIVKR